MSAKKFRSRSGSEPGENSGAGEADPGRSLSAGSMTAGPRIERGWCLNVGLGGLLFWLAGGGALEAFHGFKWGRYLEDEIRREAWTLAHAHGTLFSAVCLLLALLLPALGLSPAARKWADRLFAAGAVLLPLGFLLGGISHSEGDPGPLILLVPIGGGLAALSLFILLAARRFESTR